MGALHAFPTIAEEDQPLYDGKPTGKRRHLTVIADDVVDHVIETCGFTAAGIYTLLERRANKDGICRNISYSTIQERGAISRRHAIRLVQQLQDAGFLTIRSRMVRGRHVENEFFLPLHLSGDTPSGNNGGSGDIVVTPSSDIGGDTTPVSGDMGSDTSGDTPIYKKSSQSNQEVIEDIPSTTADDSSSRPPTTSMPYLLLEAMLDEQGFPVADLSQAEKGKQLAATKRIASAGLTEANVRAIVRWLRGYMSGVDAFDVERSIPKWRIAGMPSEPTSAKPKKPLAYNDPRNANGFVG